MHNSAGSIMADHKIATTTFGIMDHLFDRPGTRHVVAVDAIQYAMVPGNLQGEARVKVVGQNRMHRTDAAVLLQTFARAGADVVGLRQGNGELAIVRGRQIASYTAKAGEGDTAVTFRLNDGQRLTGSAAPDFCESYQKITVAEASRPAIGGQAASLPIPSAA